MAGYLSVQWYGMKHPSPTITLGTPVLDKVLLINRTCQHWVSGMNGRVPPRNASILIPRPLLIEGVSNSTRQFLHIEHLL